MFCAPDKIVRLVPSDTNIYAWFNTTALLKNSDDAMNKLSERAPTLSLAKRELEARLVSELEGAGVNYEEEFLMALGDQAGIINLATSSDWEPIMIIELADANLAQGILDKVADEYDMEDSEEYGLTVYETPYIKEVKSPVYLTILDNYLVGTLDVANLQAVLDVERGEKISLDKSSAYKDVMKEIDAGGLMYVYANPKNVLSVKSIRDSEYYMAIDGLMGEIQKMGLSLSPKKDGLGLRTYLDQPGAGTNVSLELLKYVPQDAAAVVLGYNPSREFLDMKSSLRNNNQDALARLETF